MKVNTYKSGLNVKVFNRTITVSNNAHFQIMSSRNNYNFYWNENYEIRLLDNKNKPLNNVKVNFRINGKNHIDTTHDGGYCDLRLKLNPGRHTIGISTYNSKFKPKAC